MPYPPHVCLILLPLPSYNTSLSLCNTTHKHLQDIRLIWLSCKSYNVTNFNYLVHRQDIQHFHYSPTPNLTPPFRSSSPGISEPNVCLSHSPRFSLYSNHSPARHSVVRHGSSTDMAYSTPISAASHACEQYNPLLRPGIKRGLRSVPDDIRQSPPGSKALRACAGDVSYNP